MKNLGLSPRRLSVLFLVMVICAIPSVSRAADEPAAKGCDWPQHLGPNHDGTSPETGWSTTWAEGGPKRLWELNVGKGYSCVSTRKGRAYTLGNADNTDTVFCLDAVTGKEIWKKSYACKPTDYPGPRCSPTLDGDRVYTLSSAGHVICWNAATGEKVWSKDAADLGGRCGNWGYACSPLVLGDRLIVDVGLTAALDKNTGQVVWKTPPYTPGYSSPKAFQSGDRHRLAVFTGDGLMILNAADGKRIGALFPWKTNWDVNAALPIVSGDSVFITSNYGRGGALLKATDNGLEKVWENKEIASHFATPVLLDGCLYGSAGGVGRGPFKCLDFKTGQVKWTHNTDGSQILVGGKMLVLTTRGRLAVVDPSPAGYKEIAYTNVGPGAWWNAPVLSHGLIYCRSHEGKLVCLDVRK